MAKSRQTAGRSSCGHQARKQLQALSDGRIRRRSTQGTPHIRKGVRIKSMRWRGGRLCIRMLDDQVFGTSLFERKEMIQDSIVNYTVVNGGAVTEELAAHLSLLDATPENVQDGGMLEVTKSCCVSEKRAQGDEHSRGFRGHRDPRENRGKGYPIAFYSLLENYKMTEKMKALFFIAKSNPNKWLEINEKGLTPSMKKTKELAALQLKNIPIECRSKEAEGYVPMSAGDALIFYDPEVAEIISKFNRDTYTMGPFIRSTQREIRTCGMQRPLRKIARRGGKSTFSPMQKLDWLLNQNSGLYLVQVEVDGVKTQHIISLDCAMKRVLDPLEEWAFKLTPESLAIRGYGGAGVCTGLREVWEIFMHSCKEGYRWNK